jgi:TM2 domain-containing membrane protein YozV
MMKIKISILFIVLAFPIISQEIDFKSPNNIKLFADFLFCEKDYLRAIDEYEKYLKVTDDDTVQFKIALAYSRMNDVESSLKIIDQIKETSVFCEESLSEKLKLLFMKNDDSLFYQFAGKIAAADKKYQKLYNIYGLLNEVKFKNNENFLFPFDDEEKISSEKFYDQKLNPPYKSEMLAGIFSALIPGSGKIYTEEYGDGITAFILTGLFSYLAYTNFDHKHYTRAWIFTAIGAGFYTGNIYGSVASAQIFNAKVNFDFENGVKLYLEEKNYFTPEYEFCK